jgi:hypothetical protein
MSGYFDRIEANNCESFEFCKIIVRKEIQFKSKKFIENKINANKNCNDSTQNLFKCDYNECNESFKSKAFFVK